jgi:pimeloyl-ACP methyl ester carboxylesterase
MQSILLVAALSLGFVTLATAQEPVTGYAPVNGLELYYEIHGEGRPLVLIHGAYVSIPSNWDGLIPTLSESRQVIAVELQGHGRTTDRDTPITYEGMADDVSALLEHLKIPEADVFGYSMGGGVAIQLASRHPEQVGKLIVASASISYDGFPEGFYEMIEGVTPEMMADTPFAAEYKRLSPTPENFPKLVEKLRALDLDRFDWPEQEMAKIEGPTLLIFGDADVVTMDHIARMHRVFGGVAFGDVNGLPKLQLAVLPGTSHIGVFFNPANVEIMKQIVPAFLAAELPQPPMQMGE